MNPNEVLARCAVGLEIVNETLGAMKALLDALADRVLILEEQMDLLREVEQLGEVDELRPCDCGRPCTGERCSACEASAA